MAWENHTITPKEYFRLATHQFPQRGCPLSAWQLLDTETFYNHGLVAATYLNEAKKIVLIAYHLLDSCDITQETLNYAYDFAVHAKEKARLHGYQIAYTGYGEGGSIAELCAIKDKLQACTFDSKPIFDSSPEKNSYINLVRYTSDPTPQVIYGNVFYVDIFSQMDAELLERWHKALNYVNASQKVN